MAGYNLSVDVEAKLTVSAETAEACIRLLDIFCSNQRGDTSKRLGRVTCSECALCKSGYCRYRQAPMYVENDKAEKIIYGEGEYGCPTCGAITEVWKAYERCPECGQLLNWEV